MKIVFMGTPQFAVVSLKKLIESRHRVLAVVTVPDKKRGRGQKMGSSAVKEFASENNIPVLQPVELKSADFIKTLQAMEPDLFVVVAFRILPREVFAIPPKGTVNIHASLLPKYRGAAPINWAIMNGDSETGVTTMHIDEKVDTGDILLQEKVKIDPETTAGDLHDTLAVKGSELLLKTIEKIEMGNLTPILQNDALATKAPKINSETCRLNFSDNAQRVHDHIRGLSPYPAAFAIYNDKIMKFYQSSILDYESIAGQAGAVIAVDKDSFVIACGTGSIKITEVQPEGRKRMSVKEFFNGYKMPIGSRFD
ncbi:MAG: methionyl-tRNA formyltransferase [Calditrichaceae bacterium]